ncbi:MAG: hypothetical protein WCR31_07630 [Treponema sp.]
MMCRKFCTLFSLILALISVAGYACVYSVYTAQSNALILQTASERTGAVLAAGCLSAQKPECSEIRIMQQKQSAPLRTGGEIDLHAYTTDFAYIPQCSQKPVFLPQKDVYTQFENKYLDTIITLQTLN